MSEGNEMKKQLADLQQQVTALEYLLLAWLEVDTDTSLDAESKASTLYEFLRLTLVSGRLDRKPVAKGVLTRVYAPLLQKLQSRIPGTADA